MERARLQGHPRLPAFVAVHLLQRLCAAMEHAPLQTDHALTVDSVSLHFDGSFSVQGSAGPEEDARALAALFEPLAGAPEDELALVLRGEFESPRLFSARLGHWAVKQRQVAGSMELGVALLAWLFPEDAPQPTPPELAEYFVATRTEAPVMLRVRPRVQSKTQQPTRRPTRQVALGLVACALVGFGLFALRPQSEVCSIPHDELAQLRKPVPPPPQPTKPPTPVLLPVSAPIESLPRYGHGAPKNFVLRPSVHGIDVTGAGFEVTAPAPTWSARTSFASRAARLPNYAALYAAEFDAKHQWLRLTEIGQGWTALSGASARFFVVQTDHPPTEGTFDLALATGIDSKRKLGERRRDVFTDATSQQEGLRYILDELDPTETYLVTLQKHAAGAGAPVIVSATRPRHLLSNPLPFQERGPWLQTALIPGLPVQVTAVSRLSFVMLNAPGMPQGDLEVKVQRKRDVVVSGSNAEAMNHYNQGEQALLRGDYLTAISAFTRCIAVDPRSNVCNDLLAQSRRMWELQLK